MIILSHYSNTSQQTFSLIAWNVASIVKLSSGTNFYSTPRPSPPTESLFFLDLKSKSVFQITSRSVVRAPSRAFCCRARHSQVSDHLNVRRSTFIVAFSANSPTTGLYANIKARPGSNKTSRQDLMKQDGPLFFFSSSQYNGDGGGRVWQLQWTGHVFFFF